MNIYQKIDLMKYVIPYKRKPRNSFESSYYMPVPMNEEGGVFSIPNEMVSKKERIKLDTLENYLVNRIYDDIKKCPYKNQFIENNHILIDFVETYYPDRIIEEVTDRELMRDWI